MHSAASRMDKRGHIGHVVCNAAAPLRRGSRTDSTALSTPPTLCIYVLSTYSTCTQSIFNLSPFLSLRGECISSPRPYPTRAMWGSINGARPLTRMTASTACNWLLVRIREHVLHRRSVGLTPWFTVCAVPAMRWVHTADVSTNAATCNTRTQPSCANRFADQPYPGQPRPV